MKYRYIRFIFHYSVFCRRCGWVSFSGTIYLYGTKSHGLICDKCIEKFEDTDILFSMGLEVA